MIWSLIKLDLRKVLPTYLALLVIQLGFVLGTRDILGSDNVFVLVLAMAQGWLLAYRLFRDEPNTPSFLFSRAWSRARIFWNRWGLAIALQSVTVGLVTLLIASGTRTLLYQRELPFFPMVEPFELSILWPIALALVISFHIIMFLMAKGAVDTTGGGRVWRAIVVKVALGLILMVFIAGRAFVVVLNPGGTVGLYAGDLALAYAVVLAILCTAASLNCYKHMEVGA
jgi:hypothetical protein